MYLPRIGPANRYDPAARQQQQRPQGLLGVNPQFQAAQIDQGLLQQGLSAPQVSQAQESGVDIKQLIKQAVASASGLPSGVPALPGAPPPATAASMSALNSAAIGAPAPGSTMGAFDQAVDKGIDQARFAPTPFQQQMENYPGGVPSQLALKLGNAVRGGLDFLGIPDAVNSLQGRASSGFDQTGLPDAMRTFRTALGGGKDNMQRQIPPEIMSILRQYGRGR
jgi:hypothetical protein